MSTPEIFKCTFPGCEKSYTTKSGLRYHTKSSHQKEGEKPPAPKPAGGARAKEGERPNESVDAKRRELQEMQANKEFFHEKSVQMTLASGVTLASDVLLNLIEEAIQDLCFEVHRKAKLEGPSFGLLDPSIEKPEADIFGNIPNVNSILIDCPHCKRGVGGAKFATHLEKCMGFARSSRIAAKRAQPEPTKEAEKVDYSDLFGDFEDDENDSTYVAGDKKRKKPASNKPPKPRKKKNSAPSPTGSIDGASPASDAGSPSTETPVPFQSFDSQTNSALTKTTPTSQAPPFNPSAAGGIPAKKLHEKAVTRFAKAILLEKNPQQLEEIMNHSCGAISTSGRICQKGRCTIHSDEQRQLARRLLLHGGAQGEVLRGSKGSRENEMIDIGADDL